LDQSERRIVFRGTRKLSRWSQARSDDRRPDTRQLGIESRVTRSETTRFLASDGELRLSLIRAENLQGSWLSDPAERFGNFNQGQSTKKIARQRFCISAFHIGWTGWRTPHGGNAVALYAINWKWAERAERERRKKA
jgi:hypothetical protein